MAWVYVDDAPQEASSYAASLESDGRLNVEVVSVAAAEDLIKDPAFRPAGILLDVDLSNEPGTLQSGPAIAQAIRVKQQNKSLGGFPIVRFSLRSRVLENIGRDSSSDDLFDLKIDKDRLADPCVCLAVVEKLMGVATIYEGLSAPGEGRLNYLKLSGDQIENWLHPSLISALESADRTHIAASTFMQLFALPGLLVDEALLAVRLGIDRSKSTGWPALLGELGCTIYTGLGAGYFKRWWMAGVDDWWFNNLAIDRPLATLTIHERIAALEPRTGIVPLTMPSQSLGSRPWRFCTLSWEESLSYIPVDPEFGVRVRPRQPLPIWADPLYAALGPALESRDPRCDKSDIDRLEKPAS